MLETCSITVRIMVSTETSKKVFVILTLILRQCLHVADVELTWELKVLVRIIWHNLKWKFPEKKITKESAKVLATQVLGVMSQTLKVERAQVIQGHVLTLAQVIQDHVLIQVIQVLILTLIQVIQDHVLTQVIRVTQVHVREPLAMKV